jgi:hypothetical protein
MVGFSKVEVIERERGKPLKEVLQEEFKHSGTLAGLARNLGVSQGTIQNWLLKCNLQIKIELVEWERGA